MDVSATTDVDQNNVQDEAIWNKDFDSINDDTDSLKGNDGGYESNNYGYIDDKILRMMSKMGFKTGEGLGRTNQGIVDPLNVMKKLNRKGFGHTIERSEPAHLIWDTSLEVIEVKEQIHWLESYTDESNIFQKINILEWQKIGPPILSIIDEIQYCDPELLQKVLKGKEIFDELDPIKLCRARSRANSFETLRSAFFMNRAALKMANIDAITEFMFSDIDRQVEHRQSNSPYFFADICAGPGGFSEYILWRKRWAFKGFGMTLRGDNDFRIHESSCAPSETFEALYGVLDDGDIYYPDNIKQFCSKLKSQTNELGVHFVMADGGFSVEGQENIQEVLSKKLYICQCLTALSALRANGHFVVKMFDMFTPFSVGLIFLMYQCFHKIAIIKPNSSRPANSERYMVCSRLKYTEQTKVIREYLEMTVQTLWELQVSGSNSILDVTELVAASILKADQKFCNYIIETNNRLAQKQIVGLLKLETFCRDPTLVEPQQEQLRSACLRVWRIPDKPKVPLPLLIADDLLPPCVFSEDFVFAKEIVSSEDLNGIFQRLENWHCMFVATARKCNLCNIYVGLGWNRVYRYQRCRWVKVKCVQLIRGTVLFAELVKESTNADCSVFKKSLHVIDALRLGDTSLADLAYTERLDLINIYCQAINCESRSDLASVRVKTILPMSQLSTAYFPISCSEIEQSYLSSEINFQKRSYVTNAILFLKSDSSQNFYSTLSSRYIMHLSSEKECNMEYEKSCLWKSMKDILAQNIYLLNT